MLVITSCQSLLFIGFTLYVICHEVSAQFGPEGRPDPPGTPKRTKTKYSAVPEEANFLKCDVCKKSVGEMFYAVAGKRASRKKKLTEEEVLEVVEQTCKPFATGGQWILRTDLFQPEEERLEMVERQFMSRCKTECETVARACHDTLGDVDTDVAEIMYHNTMPLDELMNEVCHEMTDACKRKRSLTKPHQEERFSEMPEKEYDMFKMIEETNYGGGRGGLSLYSREDIEETIGGNSKTPEPAADDHYSSSYDQEPSYYRSENDDPLPPDSWIEWVAWKVQTTSRWVKSLFIDDPHDEL